MVGTVGPSRPRPAVYDWASLAKRRLMPPRHLMFRLKSFRGNGTSRFPIPDMCMCRSRMRWPDGKFVSSFGPIVIRQPAGRLFEQVDSRWMSLGWRLNKKAWETMAQIAIGPERRKRIL